MEWLRRFIDASDGACIVRDSELSRLHKLSRPYTRATRLPKRDRRLERGLYTVKTQREAKDRIRAASEEPF